MGLDRTIRFTSVEPTTWPAILAKLNELGISASLRMIDNLPAFPDEVPPPDWRELRLGFAAGMVTVRRVGTDLACVVWGTADAGLTAAQDAVADSLAGQGGGGIPRPPG